MTTCPICIWNPDDPSTSPGNVIEVNTLCYEHQLEYMIALTLKAEEASESQAEREAWII